MVLCIQAHSYLESRPEPAKTASNDAASGWIISLPLFTRLPDHCVIEMTCIFCSWADCLPQLSWRFDDDGHEIMGSTACARCNMLVHCHLKRGSNLVNHWADSFQLSWLCVATELIAAAEMTSFDAEGHEMQLDAYVPGQTEHLSFAMWEWLGNSMVNSADNVSWLSAATDLAVCCNSAENRTLFKLRQHNCARTVRNETQKTSRWATKLWKGHPWVTHEFYVARIECPQFSVKNWKHKLDFRAKKEKGKESCHHCSRSNHHVAGYTCGGRHLVYTISL